MNRLASIDIAKALCIILVVVGHYHPDNSPEWYDVLNRFIYSFHMPLFMFAGGYVYMKMLRPESYGAFVFKKFKRLMIPYFSVSIIIISIKLFTQPWLHVDNPVSIFAFLKIFYLPEAGYFLWFIWALWLMFLILPLIKSRNGRTFFFFLSLLFEFTPIQLPEIFCIKETVMMFKYFMLGVFLCEYPYLISKVKNISFVWSAIFFLLLFVIKQMNQATVYSHIISFFLPYLGVYSVCMISISIAKYFKHLAKILLIISSSSYIIYLFHTTFEGFAKSFVYKIPFMSNNSSFLGFTIGVILVSLSGVLLPILLHRFILVRISFLRFFFGLKSNKIKITQ